MYASEHEFVKYLTQRLKQHGWFCQRVETGSTGNGVPDLFCAKKLCGDIWIECKNDVKQSIDNKSFDMHWRPGQRAWHDTYRYNHKYDKGVHKCVLTLMSVRDGIVAVRSGSLNSLSKVNRHEPDVLTFSFVDWHNTRITDLLQFMMFDITEEQGRTNRDWLEKFLRFHFKTIWDELDWDADVLWESAKEQFKTEYWLDDRGLDDCYNYDLCGKFAWFIFNDALLHARVAVNVAE